MPGHRSRLGLPTLLVCCALLPATSASARGPEVWALTGARIVTAPGEAIESGTLVVRDGVIAAVGTALDVPADARRRELEGLTIYPGLIDAYVERSWPEAGDDARTPGGGHDNALVTPERDMAAWVWDESGNEKLRAAGFTTAVVAPAEGVLRGQSVLVNLGDGDAGANLLARGVAQNVSWARTGFGGAYPASLMGAVALLRQTFLDAAWHERAWTAWRRAPGQPRPAANGALDALAPAARGEQPVVFESEDPAGALRAAALAQELGLDAWLVGSGREYEWLQPIVATGLPILVPVAFPEVPDVGEVDDLSVTLAELRHWDSAPDNPRHLLAAGARLALTTHDLATPGDLLSNLHEAISRGLDADQALAALTVSPAELLGIGDRAGTLAPGKMANFVVVEGDLFAKQPEVREVWIDGRRHEIEKREPPEIDPAGTWELTVTTPDGETMRVRLELAGDAENLTGTIAAGEGTGDLPLAAAAVSGSTLTARFDSTPLGMPGEIEFTLAIEGDSGRGSGTSPEGPFTLRARRTATPDGGAVG